MKRTKQAVLYGIMILIVCFVAYAGLELAVRHLALPDPALIRDIEMELASIGNLEQAFGGNAPKYGWDQEILQMPMEANTKLSETAWTILFLGDSITRGFGVDVRTEAYPVLLLKVFNKAREVRVVNAAVQGFGVDQMMLKLEELVPAYRPALVVFAYIPHDLWRSARNVNYGNTKPVLREDASGNWKLHPSQNLRQFYLEYSNAKRRYHLSVWSLSHVANNLRYYFPKLYTAYYRGLFAEIRDRLVALAGQYDMEILVVRLASTWPGGPVPFLDNLAQDIFVESSGSPRYQYFDSENCIRAHSVALAIDYEEEFKYHPSATGHKLYRDCLLHVLERYAPGCDTACRTDMAGTPLGGE